MLEKFRILKHKSTTPPPSSSVTWLYFPTLPKLTNYFVTMSRPLRNPPPARATSPPTPPSSSSSPAKSSQARKGGDELFLLLMPGSWGRLCSSFVQHNFAPREVLLRVLGRECLVSCALWMVVGREGRNEEWAVRSEELDDEIAWWDRRGEWDLVF
jgi:hypothetical protein